MKASEYIKEYGDFEITEDIEKCIPYKPKTVWDLKKGDTCYWIDGYNNVRKNIWDNSDFFKKQREIGFITLTEKELELKRESMKVYEELKRYAKEFTDEEWKDVTTPKFEIYFDYRIKKIEIDDFGTLKCNKLYFEFYDKAEEAIEAVGEERIKKYYLGVEK